MDWHSPASSADLGSTLALPQRRDLLPASRGTACSCPPQCACSRLRLCVHLSALEIEHFNFLRCWLLLSYFLFSSVFLWSGKCSALSVALRATNGIAPGYDVIMLLRSRSLGEKTSLFSLIAVYYSLGMENHSFLNTRESQMGETAYVQTDRRETNSDWSYNLALTWIATNGSSSLLLIWKLAIPSPETYTCFPVHALPSFCPEITSQ